MLNEISKTLAIFEVEFDCGDQVTLDTTLCSNQTFVLHPGDGLTISGSKMKDSLFRLEPLPLGQYNFDLLFKNGVECVKKLQLNITYKTCVQTAHKTPTDQFELHPNPSSGLITLRGQDLDEERHMLEVISPTGQTLQRRFFDPFNKSHTEEMNLTNLPVGLYLVKITSQNRNWIRQLILTN